MQSKKAQHEVGIIITIVFVILIIIVFGHAVAGVTGARAHELAYDQLREKIENLCESESELGSESDRLDTLTIYLPDSDGKKTFYSIEIKDNIISLKKEKETDAPNACSNSCTTEKTDKLDCTEAVDDLFIDTTIGGESVEVVIEKIGNEIKLRKTIL